MKIAIIGCGLNSDYHIRFAREYPGAEIIGVVDRDEAKAKACAERHGIAASFTSLGALVAAGKPDVIHVVTPPRTHAVVVREALEAKCHVLVEKPMALDRAEAQRMYELADQQGVSLCTMHNHFFDPCMAEVHERISRGELGRIIGVESYYGLNTRIPAFRDYPVPNELPWLYTMPGGVYHDFMAHPLYVMLEYTGRPLELTVMKRTFGTLPHGMPDELRILVNGEHAFGTLTFSFASRPHLHFLKVYGTEMTAEVDFNTMSNVVHGLSSLPKAAQKATYNLAASWQLFKRTTANVVNFLRGKLRPYQGMQVLIHRFYDHVAGKGPVPVTREQALRVLGVMDDIWKQLEPPTLSFAPVLQGAAGSKERVLVTGGTGFMGRQVVRRLREEGYVVRVLARKLSNIAPLKGLGVEIFFGDVADRTSLAAAFAGVDLVVHAAADTEGDARKGEVSTVLGTRNIVDLVREHKVRKLVYISSCSVYNIADHREGDVVSEGASLEQAPELRGAYSCSKLQAERIVTEAMAADGLPAVCLRPGTYFGPGGDLFTPMMGLSLGRRIFAIIGRGDMVLPLVSIDNLVDAIVAVLRTDKESNKVYNIVNSDMPTKRQYVDRFLRRLYPKATYIYIPYRLFYGIVYLQEVLVRLLNRSPFLTRYRLESSQKRISYDASRIRADLAWTQPFSLDETYEKVIRYEQAKAAGQ